MIKKQKKIQTASDAKKRNPGFRGVKLLILDVDGVLTSGDIIYDSRGAEYKIFNAQDGYGIEKVISSGVKVAIVSGRTSEMIERRAAELGIEDVYQGVRDKAKVLRELLMKYRLDPKQVCCMGDDVPDIGLMKKTGVPVAVSNARPEVKKAAVYVTRIKGGHGAVREIADLITR